jgi:transposase-like protein
LYPVLFLDALRVNIREGSTVVKKSVYLALAIRLDGQKELLGRGLKSDGSSTTRGRRTFGSRFGILNRSRKAEVPLLMGIMNELKNQGVKDILLAAVDGLAGSVQALVFAISPPRKELPRSQEGSYTSQPHL